MAPTISPWHRVPLAIVGGYLLTSGTAGLIAYCLTWVMPRSEAAVLMSMLAFVLYLAILIWAFAERRVWLLWSVLVAFGAGSYALLLWLSSITPSFQAAAAA